MKNGAEFLFPCHCLSSLYTPSSPSGLLIAKPGPDTRKIPLKNIFTLEKFGSHDIIEFCQQ